MGWNNDVADVGAAAVPTGEGNSATKALPRQVDFIRMWVIKDDQGPHEQHVIEARIACLWRCILKVESTGGRCAGVAGAVLHTAKD